MADDEQAPEDPEVFVGFCYGTVASLLPKRNAPDAHSHRWTVFVRGAFGEDLSHLISKVTFALHPSFVPPTRVLDAPPYEVTETGWGEFEIGITIQLVAEAECAPVDLVHALKLYHEAEPPGPESAADSAAQAARLLRPVVRERYDELVFVHPPDALREILEGHEAIAATAGEPLVAGLCTPYENEEVWCIAAARNSVAQHAARIKAQLDARPEDEP